MSSGVTVGGVLLWQHGFDVQVVISILVSTTQGHCLPTWMVSTKNETAFTRSTLDTTLSCLSERWYAKNANCEWYQLIIDAVPAIPR